MSVYFYNSEPIDINSIAIMGVSVKTGDNPIGFFGTGLKFAIATLLRNGCKITLYRKGEEIKFDVATENIRGEEFDRVVMGDERLGFTTKLGRTWEPWQAYRELYCNCIDEGGTIDTTAPVGEWGTVFAIQGEAIENCHRSRHEIFLDTRPIAADGNIEIHNGNRLDTFYRGVRAHRHQSAKLFTYNVIGKLSLTEDRTIKEPFYIGYYAVQLIPTIEDESLIEAVITAPKGTFEHGLNFESCLQIPSKAFMAVCRAHRHNAHANFSAMKLWEKFADNQITFSEASIDKYEELLLEQSMALLRRIGCPIERDDFRVVEGMGEGCYGMVRRGQILIAKRTFDHGHRFLASTLYEEWLHKNEHMEDESRDLQNLLFEKLFSMVERVCVMEAA